MSTRLHTYPMCWPGRKRVCPIGVRLGPKAVRVCPIANRAGSNANRVYTFSARMAQRVNSCATQVGIVQTHFGIVQSRVEPGWDVLKRVDTFSNCPASPTPARSLRLTMAVRQTDTACFLPCFGTTAGIELPPMCWAAILGYLPQLRARKARLSNAPL